MCRMHTMSPHEACLTMKPAITSHSGGSFALFQIPACRMRLTKPSQAHVTMFLVYSVMQVCPACATGEAAVSQGWQQSHPTPPLCRLQMEGLLSHGLSPAAGGLQHRSRRLHAVNLRYASSPSGLLPDAASRRSSCHTMLPIIKVPMAKPVHPVCLCVCSECQVDPSYIKFLVDDSLACFTTCSVPSPSINITCNNGSIGLCIGSVLFSSMMLQHHQP